MIQHRGLTMVPIAHPGRLLKRELASRKLSTNRLSLDIGVPSGRITDILNGRRSITADTAVRLGRYFGAVAFPRPSGHRLAEGNASHKNRAILARFARPVRHRLGRAREGRRDQQACAAGGRGVSLPSVAQYGLSSFSKKRVATIRSRRVVWSMAFRARRRRCMARRC